MGWPYHFRLDFSHEQKHERRILLDFYGSVAQLSCLLLPVIAYIISWTIRYIRQSQSTDLDIPSSPYGKHDFSKRTSLPVTAQRYLRRFQWWAGDDARVLGFDLGPNGAVLATVLWTGWSLMLCFLQTGDDYMHVTKRFGAVAAAQLPFQYLLAVKSPYSPIQYLTGYSHESLNRLHRHLGYILTFLFYLHVIAYVNFFVQFGNMLVKLQALYIIVGFLAIISFTSISTTALGPIRRWSYRFFYLVHVTLSIAILPALYLHVSHIRIYLFETAAVYALNVLLRALASRTETGTIRLISDSQLLAIDIAPPKSPAGRKRLLNRWQPGRHAYLSVAGHPALRTFRSNPFTVASVPAVDGRLRFVARVLDGNTLKFALGAKASRADHMLTVEGPYGVATHPDTLLGYERILLVAGGVGATLIVPLYRQLLADLSPSKGSYRRQKVSFVWVARSRADVAWALPEESKERAGFVERLKVHVTGAGTVPSGNDSPDDDLPSTIDHDSEEGIELEERAELLQQNNDEGGDFADKESSSSLALTSGRPNWSRVVDQTFSHGAAERVAVMVCGPSSLAQDLRGHVGRWVKRGREVWFWDESFAY